MRCIIELKSVGTIFCQSGLADISRLGSNLWLEINNLQLYRTINFEYVRKQFDIRYKIKNYHNKATYKAKDKS